MYCPWQGVRGTAPLNPAAYVPNLVSACSMEECAFYTRKLDRWATPPTSASIPTESKMCLYEMPLFD